jgi:hypothetical protein
MFRKRPLECIGEVEGVADVSRVWNVPNNGLYALAGIPAAALPPDPVDFAEAF